MEHTRSEQHKDKWTDKFHFWVNHPFKRHTTLKICLSGMLLRGISKLAFALSFSSTQTSVILWKNNRIVHSQNAPRSRVQCPVSGACQGRSCIFSAIWQREAQTSHLKLHNSQQSHSSCCFNVKGRQITWYSRSSEWKATLYMWDCRLTSTRSFIWHTFPFKDNKQCCQERQLSQT